MLWSLEGGKGDDVALWSERERKEGRKESDASFSFPTRGGVLLSRNNEKSNSERGEEEEQSQVRVLSFPLAVSTRKVSKFTFFLQKRQKWG